jgi:hypothetical protein
MDMKRGIQAVIMLGLILSILFVQHRMYLKDASLQAAANQQEEGVVEEEPKLELIDYSAFYMEEDTVYLPNPSGYTFQVNQNDINHLMDTFPELFQKHMMSPEEAADTARKRNLIRCLVDGDYFDVEYYYLMRKRNGEGFWSEPREKLQTILLLLNDLSLCEAITGTYHAHDISRILAKTEYEMYLLKENPRLLHDHYDMTKQIRLYIETLRQWVRDENNFQIDYVGEDRAPREREFQIIVDKLERNITNAYYLNHAQEYFNAWLRND